MQEAGSEAREQALTAHAGPFFFLAVSKKAVKGGICKRVPFLQANKANEKQKKEADKPSRRYAEGGNKRSTILMCATSVTPRRMFGVGTSKCGHAGHSPRLCANNEERRSGSPAVIRLGNEIQQRDSLRQRADRETGSEAREQA